MGETLIVCSCWFIAIECLYWKFKLYCTTFFSKMCASKFGVRLIYGCGLYMDVYGTFCFSRTCNNENKRETYRAALTLGRQEGNVGVWVIGDTRVDNEGNVLQENNHKCVFVPELLIEKLTAPDVMLLFDKSSHNHLILSLKQTIHDNYVAVVFTIGKKLN